MLMTVLYNIYMWHLAYLYAPSYKKVDLDAEQQLDSFAGSSDANRQGDDQANQTQMAMLNGRPSNVGDEFGMHAMVVPTTQMSLQNPNDVSRGDLEGVARLGDDLEDKDYARSSRI